LIPTTGLLAPKPSLGGALPSKERPLHRSRIPQMSTRSMRASYVFGVNAYPAIRAKCCDVNL
jgi:hypothetical protein